MSVKSNWFAVDKTQRLVPLSDDEIAAPMQEIADVEGLEPPVRITLEKMQFTATEVIRISFKDVVPAAPPAPRHRNKWCAIGLALVAVTALVCLL